MLGSYYVFMLFGMYCLFFDEWFFLLWMYGEYMVEVNVWLVVKFG